MFGRFTLKNILTWGTYLLIFLLPWQTRWIYWPRELNGGFFEYGSASLYATQILLIILAVLFIIWRRQEKNVWPNFNLTRWLLIFFAWSALSLIWSADKYIASQHLFLLVSGILFFFIVAYGPTEKIKILLSFSAAAALQALLALQQFFTQDIFASKWLGMAAQSAQNLGVFVIEYGDQRWLRAYGSLPHPNILGAFLAVALLVLLALSLQATDRNKRLFVGLSFVLVVPALLLTFSRAAWLGALVGLIYLLIVWFRQKKITPVVWQLLLAGAVLSIVTVAIFYQPFLSRAVGDARLEILSNVERVNLFEQAKIIITGYSLIGVGLGNYPLAVYNIINSTWPVWAYQPVHNLYLLIWAELGAVGLLIFLALVVLAFFHRSSSSPLARALFLTLVVISLFDHFFWTLYPGVMLWWLVIALTQKQNSYDQTK